MPWGVANEGLPRGDVWIKVVGLYVRVSCSLQTHAVVWLTRMKDLFETKLGHVGEGRKKLGLSPISKQGTLISGAGTQRKIGGQACV